MARKGKNKPGKRIAQKATALRSNGLKAFQNGDYQKAISTWERIPENLRPTSALAEAYFRRGLEHLHGPEPAPQAGLLDLQQAISYQPDDQVYAHHLGLAAHRLGDLEQAVLAYRMARRTSKKISDRTAYPLALALLQQKQDPSSDPVWDDLSDDEKVMMIEIGAFHHRPYKLSPEAPLLWRSLVALDEGDHSTAQLMLNEFQAATPIEKGIVSYYRGITAALTEDWDTTRREWVNAYAAGLRSERLLDNLAELFHRTAEELLTNGEPKTALAAAQESALHKPNDRSLKKLMSQIYHHLGYQAASANRWDEAQSHWQKVLELDGSSFRLAYNLALSYEHSENYQAASETWSEALRRRPRSTSHPDAITDEQVARLWQRTAEAYRKADQYDDTIRVYQNAIK
ncbi:MAG: hypothetical protein MUO76_04275 [Anaerolineaceae bacterium]|nr:hypothetical protein [Anaerolineaceae bacterium]